MTLIQNTAEMLLKSTKRHFYNFFGQSGVCVGKLDQQMLLPHIGFCFCLQLEAEEQARLRQRRNSKPKAGMAIAPPGQDPHHQESHSTSTPTMVTTPTSTELPTFKEPGSTDDSWNVRNMSNFWEFTMMKKR